MFVVFAHGDRFRMVIFDKASFEDVVDGDLASGRVLLDRGDVAVGGGSYRFVAGADALCSFGLDLAALQGIVLVIYKYN